MLQPLPLSAFPRYPVVTTVAVLAAGASVMWWTGHEIEAMETSARIWSNWELWRGLTSTLPHVNIMHLAFNLYWFWVFGTLLERHFGHWRFAGIVLLLAFGSGLAEFSLLQGGVGLSGVGYGLWGMLFVLERRDARFAGTVDARTNELFIVWFFACIVLTVTGIMPVGNIAHGMGAVLGALLGLAVSGERSVRGQAMGGLAILLALCVAGSTVFWPRINLSEYSEVEVERIGYEAMHRGDYARAAKMYDAATKMRHVPARAWFSLGISYHHLGKFSEALAAYQQAAKMPDATPEMQNVARDVGKYMDLTKPK